ncbi:MAG: hypothetical protein ABI824_00695 [Acidobacteriota bacterium]
MRGAVLLFLGICGSVHGADLWKSGSWKAVAPAGSCGTLPLIEVSGPGSIFDNSHSTELASLKSSLPVALATACPGVREVIIVSGKTRQLTQIPEVAKTVVAAAVPAAPATPAPAAVTAPARNPEPVVAPVVVPEATGRRAIAAAPVAPASRTEAAPAVRVITTSNRVAPKLEAKSTLPSLSSAHGDEDKCEVLLKWLESGKTGASTRVNSYSASPEMQAIFRDERMTAVFGKPYDQTENKWRLELHDKEISKCLGLAQPNRGRNVPFAGVRGPNRSLQQYRQEFQQYQGMLDEAFGGRPGQFEPTAITRFVLQVREQTAWANQAMSAAANAAETQAGFDQIATQRQSSAAKLSVLNAADRAQVNDYLTLRQKELAPPIAEAWLNERAGTEQTVFGARRVYSAHTAMNQVLGLLNASEKASWEERYDRLMDSLVVGAVRADVGKLSTVPDTLPGVMQLAGLKAGFESTFSTLRGVPSVDAAREQYQATRTRLLTDSLQAWRQDVDRVPLEAPPVAAKHQEFESLFPNKEDKSGTLYTQYETPMRSKEDQLRTLIAGNLQRQQERGNGSAAQQAANPNAPGGQLAESSFNAKGLSNEKVLANLFRGNFINVDFDRSDLKFINLFDRYIRSYGTYCKIGLPENKVEILDSGCAEWTVTENLRTGQEISRVCRTPTVIHTGIFADPALLDAQRENNQQRAADAGRVASVTLSQLTGPNGISGMMAMLGTTQSVTGDMSALAQNYAQMNACKDPGLMRFQENLRRFALNKQAIPLDGKVATSSVLVTIPGIPFKDQNYTKLISDLVVDDAQKWGAFAKLSGGGVPSSSVSSRDAEGRPAKVVSPYSYENILGRQSATVTLTFEEGMPQCLTYSETPAVCHAPNRKIVAAYLDGRYQ